MAASLDTRMKCPRCNRRPLRTRDEHWCIAHGTIIERVPTPDPEEWLDGRQQAHRTGPTVLSPLDRDLVMGRRNWVVDAYDAVQIALLEMPRGLSLLEAFQYVEDSTGLPAHHIIAIIRNIKHNRRNAHA
jgi:hypothetical protein